MPIWNDLKTSNVSYFPLVSGSPAWRLNFSGNVWDTLVDSIATLRDNVNGNTKNISNLGNLYVVAAGKVGVGTSNPGLGLNVDFGMVHVLGTTPTANKWSGRVAASGPARALCIGEYNGKALIAGLTADLITSAVPVVVNPANYVMIGVAASAPVDAELLAGTITLWLDESTNTIKARCRYQGGTYKSLTTGLAVS